VEETLSSRVDPDASPSPKDPTPRRRSTHHCHRT
jgi:hypothetical protein